MFTVVVGLLLCGWDVPYWFEKPAVVEPVDVLEGGALDLIPVPPWSPLSDEFCLVKADDRFGQGVIVGIAHGTDRGFNAGLGETVGVADG